VYTDVHVVNLVSTVELLQRDEVLCLEAISMHLSGMAKFEPKRFAAVVLRIKDSIATTTCLVFRPGKIVVVGAVTPEHSRFVCQMYRQIIERIPGVYHCNTSQRIVSSNLVGRTCFANWGVYNIVAHSHLGMRPNLKALVDKIPELATWQPELFPGLKFLIWLRPKSQCPCTRKRKNKSCDCNARLLLFDSGTIVITGCKDLQGVNLSKHLIQTLLGQDKAYLETDSELPKHLRFEARRKKLLASSFVEFDGLSKRGGKRKLSSQPNKRKAPVALEDLTRMLPTKRRPSAKPDVAFEKETNAFVRACLLGQTKNVQFMLSLNSEHPRRQEALEKIRALDRTNTEHAKIVRLLST
jgi:TATA-box binding protein (TBP) (component of TFIID and TFIIIB)